MPREQRPNHLLTFAPVAGVALALNVIVENVLVLPLLLALAERGAGGASGPWYKLAAKSFAQLARNPIVIGTAYLSQPALAKLAGAGLNEGLSKQGVLVEAISGLETVKSSSAGPLMARRWATG